MYTNTAGVGLSGEPMNIEDGCIETMNQLVVYPVVNGARSSHPSKTRLRSFVFRTDMHIEH